MRFLDAVNKCDYQCARNGVSRGVLRVEPVSEQLNPCELQPEFRYCVDHIDAIGKSRALSFASNVF